MSHCETSECGLLTCESGLRTCEPVARQCDLRTRVSSVRTWSVNMAYEPGPRTWPASVRMWLANVPTCIPNLRTWPANMACEPDPRTWSTSVRVRPANVASEFLFLFSIVIGMSRSAKYLRMIHGVQISKRARWFDFSCRISCFHKEFVLRSFH